METYTEQHAIIINKIGEEDRTVIVTTVTDPSAETVEASWNDTARVFDGAFDDEMMTKIMEAVVEEEGADGARLAELY